MGLSPEEIIVEVLTDDKPIRLLDGEHPDDRVIAKYQARRIMTRFGEEGYAVFQP